VEETADAPSSGLYQPRGQAWDPGRSDILRLLEKADQKAIQPIYHGSNYTFLVTLEAEGFGESYAIYKPAKGEYPLYDFPLGTLYRREVATYMLDAMLGWNFVPPTVIGRGRLGEGSVQLFIESYSQASIPVEDLRRLAILDVLLNNADRKPEHFLLGEGDKVWAIDHGLTFHTYNKLRTVLWHFAGSGIPEAECEDLRRLLDELSQPSSSASALYEQISGTEKRALQRRVESLLSYGALPNPRHKPVPYRW
jgi:hypothetical protein